MLWQRSPLPCEMLTGGSGWLVCVVIGADEGAPGDYRKLPVSLGGVKVRSHPKSDQVGWCWWWCVIANIISLVIQFQFWGVFFRCCDAPFGSGGTPEVRWGGTQ